MNVIAHLDPEGPAERCPTCGQRVATFTTDEGTSYYLATAEQEASEAAFLREQLAGAVRERDTALVDRARLVAEVERLRSENEWLHRQLAGRQ